MSAPTTLAYIPSPPQGVWDIGPFPLRAYALCIIVGIVIAVFWGNRRWIARGGQDGEVLDIAIWAVPFGLVGGRIYHLLTDWNTYFGDGPKTPMDALRIWDGGLGIWGAVVFGGVGAWIGARRHGVRLPAFGDAIAPAILLAQAIGRLGNYFNQELYGEPTTLPWGLEIFDRENGSGYADPAVIDGVSNGHVVAVVHPTFLYELLWNLLVVVILVTLDRRFRIGHGRLFALYVAGYCIGRFGIELMRTDPATMVAGLRINTFTAAIVFACAAAYFVIAPKGREVGLQMYHPWRAEELEHRGIVGYVDDRAGDLDDDTDDLDGTGDLDDTDDIGDGPDDLEDEAVDDPVDADPRGRGESVGEPGAAVGTAAAGVAAASGTTATSDGGSDDRPTSDEWVLESEAAESDETAGGSADDESGTDEAESPDVESAEAESAEVEGPEAESPEAEPTGSEPAASEPTASEPRAEDGPGAIEEPAIDEDPVAEDSVDQDPVDHDPVDDDPVDDDPATSDSDSSNAASSDAASSDSGSGESSSGGGDSGSSGDS
ncbi:prolipoprotein diacylglyceryl transferase [Gordonia soli]|uniref:Phosphatidylglycerol--prolipoprotein diacylglyceryl transferase n=1 Tax=Gordonia soli NBRC 108243 TaxID=1223545 RepID=M0QMT9_9ACTN|nr:prolipoprotein diacylglyceryl transferase [Gordonia soli]GAC69970.1 prolipoprotein diacylglyceryl transferase [Gordonia soli NBRC 108243]